MEEEKKKEGKPNKGMVIFIKILCYNLIFWSIIVVFYSFKDWKRLFYPKTEALVTSVSCKYIYTSDSDGGDSDVYDCLANLEYSVKGKKYVKKDVKLERTVDVGGDIYSVISEGDKITIWYKENNPSKYGIRGESIRNIILSCLLVFVSIGIFYLLRFYDKEKETA